MNDVGGSRNACRRASDDELKKVVRNCTEFIFFERGEAIEDVLDRVIAEVAAGLNLMGLESDNKSIQEVARPFVKTRMSAWGMGGRMQVIDPWKDQEGKE
jgi:hypothetical protein